MVYAFSFGRSPLSDGLLPEENAEQWAPASGYFFLLFLVIKKKWNKAVIKS